MGGERESSLLRKIRDLSVGAVRLWRNNVGKGLAIRHPNTRVREQLISECIALCESRGGSATRIAFGLAPGSGDLIGFRQLTIGPEHVGHTLAQFVSAEVKTATGHVKPDQAEWVFFVNGRGGLAFVARSVEAAEAALSAPLDSCSTG